MLIQNCQNWYNRNLDLDQHPESLIAENVSKK